MSSERLWRIGFGVTNIAGCAAVVVMVAISVTPRTIGAATVQDLAQFTVLKWSIAFAAAGLLICGTAAAARNVARARQVPNAAINCASCGGVGRTQVVGMELGPVCEECHGLGWQLPAG